YNPSVIFGSFKTNLCYFTYYYTLVSLKMKNLVMTSLILFSILGADAQKPKLEKATFGMGCFWCTEAVFQNLNGVSNVRSGYEGGNIPNPTYEEVCAGTTNHAEVIELQYDPTK